MIFTVDSFGTNCPVNWEEIMDALNNLITEDMGKENIEEIWERYCNGEFPDIPEYVMVEDLHEEVEAGE